MAAANGSKDQALRTGDAAYRLVVPRHKIQHDPVLTDMMARNVAVRYMGPGGHVMAYPLNSNQVYNLVLIHPAKDEAHQAESCSWTSRGHTRDMLDFYSSWSPSIQRWLQHAVADGKEDVLEWHLNTHPKLPTWFIGSVTLLGDACHPMLPYVAQGASNAIEDAAVLTMALTCTSDVQLALRAYQLVRKDRAERIAASASATAANLHLPDGPAQRVRDEAIMVASRIGKGMDTETETETKAENPDKLGNAAWQDFMWGVDVMKKTIENWAAIQEQCVLMPVPIPMPMPKPKVKKLANSTAVSRAFSNVAAYFIHVDARYSSPKLRSAYFEFLRGIANYYDLTIDQTTAILTLLRAFNPLRALGNVSLISRYAPLAHSISSDKSHP
jgi:salicylate hydroxylase